MLTDSCCSNKGDALDVRVSEEHIGFMAGAGDKIDNALGQSGFNKEVAKSHCGHRSLGVELENDCVSGGDAAGNHPAHRNHSRKVERNNAGKNAHRLIVKGCVIAAGGISHAVSHCEGGSTERKLNGFFNLEDIALCLVIYLAVFNGAEGCKLIHMFNKKLAEFIEHLGPFHNRSLRPGFERFLCALNGFFNLLNGAAGSARNNFARAGVVNIHILVCF